MTKQHELSIKQNMLWNMAGSIASLVCQYLITVLVVRLSSGLDDAGLYSLAMSIYGIFSPIANYGIYSYLATDIRNEYSLGEYITLVMITSSICVLLVTFYSVLTCRENAWGVIVAYIIYRIAGIILDIMHAYDQKRHRMDIIGISLALQGILSLVLFAVFFSFTESLVSTLLLMTLGTLIVAATFDIPKTLKLTTIHLGISKPKAIRLLKSCLPIVLANVAFGAVPSIPRQYLSAICGDATLGIYASVAAPVAIIQTGATYIYNPLISYFAEYIASGNRLDFIRMLKRTLLGIAAIGIVCTLGIYLLAYPVLNVLYGKAVAAYSYLMYPLVISSLLLGMQGFFNNLLIAMRTTRSMLASSIISLIISLIICTPLVDAFTMNGTTAALALSCLAGIIYSAYCIKMQLESFCSH